MRRTDRRERQLSEREEFLEARKEGAAVKTSKVTCTGETSAGEHTGLTTVAGVALTLTGCKQSTEKCSSTGAKTEEIVTNALEGVLGVAGALRARLRSAMTNAFTDELLEPVTVAERVAAIKRKDQLDGLAHEYYRAAA